MPSQAPFSRNGASESTPLTTLAEDIASYAQTLSTYFTSFNLPQPSLEVDAPEDYPAGLPEEIQQARMNLREASTAMAALASGPKEDIMHLAWGYHDISTLKFLNHFHVAEAVPLVGSISFSQVAATTKTSEGHLRRILRFAMLNRLFREPEPGMVAHTPSSRLLVTSEQVKAWVGYRTEETAPAAFKVAEAHERWGPNAQEREQTPFSLAHSDGKLSRFDWLAQNKDKEERFALLMRTLQNHEGWKLEHVTSGYPWGDLGRNAKIVDIGGNTGAVAYALTKVYPNVNVVVEDLPTVVEAGNTSIPSEFAGRVEFRSYNFFEEMQPVTDASVYFMRFIPHDWTDKYAAKLLSNTARVMKPGQKLLIMDSVMPSPKTGVPRGTERQIRRMDMEMMCQFNSLERERGDWERVLKRADPRLEIRKISKPPGSVMSMIEVAVGSGGLKEMPQEKPLHTLAYGRTPLRRAKTDRIVLPVAQRPQCTRVKSQMITTRPIAVHSVV